MALPQPKTPFSADDFLAWDANQIERHEFVDGEVFAMAGGEDRHASVSGNLFASLHSHLKGSRCRVYMNDVKLQVAAANAFFYPDVFVTCSERDAANRLVKQEPLLVVEVLSPSTAAYDRGDKFASYRLCPTLAEYAVIDIDRRAVDLFRKNTEGLWVLHPLVGNATLTLTSVDHALALGELFADLEGDDASLRL
ncbi:MAG: Uma2 family endonuclease [Burkholderiaceae bacterium]